MPSDPAGSMYLSRMAEYKDHRDHAKINEEEMDDDSELSHSSIVNSRYLYSAPPQSQWRQNERFNPGTGGVPPFVPNSSAPMAPNLSEPDSPFNRHKRPVSDSLEHDIPSELGDFAPARMIHPDEYQDQNDDDDGRIDPNHDNNVLGLLNQIYDHPPQIK
jgi:hypothetical protein